MADRIGEYLSKVISLDVTTNRTISRIEFSDQLNRIENNIAILASNFYKPVGWKEVKTNWLANQAFSYEDANRYEQNLNLLYNTLTDILNNFKYLGTFTSGEAVL